eukprot:5509958-Pleurochrysis_carterae.AAC.1
MPNRRSADASFAGTLRKAIPHPDVRKHACPASTTTAAAAAAAAAATTTTITAASPATLAISRINVPFPARTRCGDEVGERVCASVVALDARGGGEREHGRQPVLAQQLPTPLRVGRVEKEVGESLGG